MPISKATTTIAGVTDAYLSITQYGIRAKMNLPRAKALTTATRASSGGTKTLTFASAHGLVVQDYILVGGGTLPDGYKTGLATSGLKYWWAQVTAVPSATSIQYTTGTSATEAETADTTGIVWALGFKGLRIGVRFAFTGRSGAWTTPPLGWGLMLSQGPQPVGSTTVWGGLGVLCNSAPFTFTAASGQTPAYLTPNSPGVLQMNAFGRLPPSSYLVASTTVSQNALRFSCERAKPSVMFIDIMPGLFISGGTNRGFGVYMHTNDTGSLGSVTKEQFLGVLRYPSYAPSGVSGLSLATVQNTCYGWYSGDTTNPGPFVLTPTNNEGPLYVEFWCNDPSQPVDITDFGYAVIFQ